MKEISGLRSMTLSELVGEIDSNRQQGNLSSAIRLFVLDYFKNRAAAPQKSVSAPPGARFSNSDQPAGDDSTITDRS